MLPIHTILHPTDFSRNSEHAFQMACSLACDYGAHLILLHVLPPATVPFSEDSLTPADPQETLQGRFPWPQVTDAKIAVEYRVAEGDPPDEILAVAQQTNCDLIVIGTRGRTGLARLWMGSVAEEVLRKSSCPVLAVRTSRPETPSEAMIQSEPLDARDANAFNSYAWLLATCPDDKVRDGQKALEFAMKASELKGWRNPSYLDTLAAAYAEDGQFEQAVKWQKKALEFPELAAKQEEAASVRLKLYEQGKPYRDAKFK
jgi:nucleotide-binding universal stress UspA family protein